MKWEEFRNFGNTQNKKRILAARPRTLSEIKITLEVALRWNLTVRAAGNAHSWSPLFSDEGQVVVYMGDVTYEDKCQTRITINQQVL